MPNNCIAPGIGWWGRRWLQELVAVLPYGLGLPLVLLAYAGVVLALVRRTAADRLLLATLIPFFVYMGRFNDVFPRYFLPLYPALVILAAAALARLRPRVAVTVAVGVVGYGLVLSASQVARFSWDQQTMVAQWLGDRAPLLHPDDRRVGVAGNLDIDPFFRVRAPIEARGYRVTIQRLTQWTAGRPAFFVLPEWSEIAIRRSPRGPAARAALARLEAPSVGYVPVLHVPIPPYFTRTLYERLDPAFAVDVWQGAVGFRVYARSDVAARLHAASAAR
jgi:hypothetical protein